MTTVVKIEASIPWMVSRRAPDRRWIGVCDVLNLAMEADSLDELHSVVGEAIDLLFRDSLEDNELQRFFGERGWKSPDVPSRAPNGISFQVPIELLIKSMHDPEQRAH